MLIKRTSLSEIKLVPALIKDILGEFSSKISLSEQDRIDLNLLLEEALTNAIKHGNQFDGSKLVQYTIDCSSDGMVTMCIKDQGVGFNYRTLPDVKRSNEKMTESGRGIYLMKKIADEVSFNENGNEICIRKRIQL